jgi:hypothetical protein
MSERFDNYQEAHSLEAGKFKITVHPYVGKPENVFEAGAAVQYGADFQVAFHRDGAQKDDLAIVQLILPQTKVFDHTRVGEWNLDKSRVGDAYHPIARCAYGTDDVLIGEHSIIYSGQPMRAPGTNDCSMIDTPREISGAFNDKGFLTADTNTKFANYVVNLSTGKIYDSGVVWGYEVYQSRDNPNEIELQVKEPRECSLSKSKEHQDAIGRFLGVDRDAVADSIEEPQKGKSKSL